MQRNTKKNMKLTDFRFSIFVILAFFTLSSLTLKADDMMVRCVAFYNLENLFDTIHDEGKNDYEYPNTHSYSVPSSDIL